MKRSKEDIQDDTQTLKVLCCGSIFRVGGYLEGWSDGVEVDWLRGYAFYIRQERFI